jgi:plastocyanin
MAILKIKPFSIDTAERFTFANANITGNIESGNANLGNLAIANFFSGNGSALTSIVGANVSGQVGNALVASTVYTAAQPIITSVGTLTSLTVSGNSDLGSVANVKISGGSNGYVLKTDGSGNLSWIAASTGNANVGGSNSQVQFNNGTNLAGSANLTFDTTTNTLSATNFVGNGSGLTGIVASSGTATKTANGTSNVDIATASGNITMGVGGTAGVVTITTTGINANGYITASGNITGSYILGNGSSLSSITGANVTGAVAYATTANSVAGANVSGAVNLATFAGTANSVAGANVSGAVNLATFAGTANAVAGANVSGAVAYATTANSVAGANVSGQVANALVAGTVYTAAQPIITSVGTLTSVAVTGNLTAGNANISGTLTVGTITTAAGGSGNISGVDVISANFFSGSGNLLSNIQGANVTGAVGLATFAGTANAVAGANVSGAVAYATTANSVVGANVSGQVGNALVASTVYTNAQPNITSVGTLTSLSVTGDIGAANLTLTGNLIISGTTTSVNSTVTRVVDPLFELGGGANGAALLADDNKDRGLLLHYYSGSSTVDAFMGWDDSNGEFGVGSNVTVTNEVVTFNSYGNIRANVYFGNGSQLTGVTATELGTFANAGLTTDELYLQATTRLNVTASGTSGYLFDQYGATVNPTIYVTSGQTIAFNLNVSGHPFLIQTGAGSNYDTGLEHVDTTGTVLTTSSAQGKVAGTLYWKVPYGITGTYKYQCSAHGGMNGNIIVTDANIANITVGLATFATTANAVAGANVSGAVSFATTANAVALANVSGAGNIASINISGNASEILYGNGVFATAPVTYSNSNVATFLASFGNNNISTTGNVAFSGANITLGSVSNLHISGGSANYVLKTDGTGNLSWTALTTTTLVVDRFTGDGTWTMQTLSATPLSVDYTIVAIGGVLQPRNTYSVLVAVITFSEAPPVGAVVEITTVTGGTGGGGGSGSALTIQDEGSNLTTTASLINFVGNGISSTNVGNSVTVTVNGGASWTYSAISANTSMVPSYKYIVDTSTANLTLTLPASGTLGDEISIIDGTGNASTHAITVARNGGNIQGTASDMTVTTDRAAFTLAYYNSTQGWLLTNV